MVFKNLKINVAEAIKQACYRTDARLYKIANEIQHIPTFSVDPELEDAQGLAKIVDKTIKDSIDVGCDLSIVAEGILLGAFRSSRFSIPEAPKTIRHLINEILKVVFKHKGNIKQASEGIFAAIVIVSIDFKLDAQEALVVAKEDILTSAKSINAQFADEVVEILSKINVVS